MCILLHRITTYTETENNIIVYEINWNNIIYLISQIEQQHL